jgi:ATP-dependent Clp protease ATP-binding subunit ClpC
MRTILENELGAVFQRRGLRSRGWAVEWDEAAVEFLLEKGFTHDLGARPLKRAIERYLLTPLSMSIVDRQYPQGDQFLFVRRQGEELAVEFVDPDAPEEAAGEGELEAPIEEYRGELSLRRLVLQAHGSREEVAFLGSEYEKLQTLIRGEGWQERKSTALAMTQMTDFWTSPDRFEILGQVEYQERVERALRGAGSLLGRLGAGRRKYPERRYPPNLVGALAHNLYLLDCACLDVEANRSREAFLRRGRDRTARRTPSPRSSERCISRGRSAAGCRPSHSSSPTIVRRRTAWSLP